MSEYPDLICPLTTSPIVLVGQVMTVPKPIASAHNSRFDGRPTQLFRIDVKVENVLKSQISTGHAVIFFYMNVDSFGGNERLGAMVAGERDVFFLLTDAGNLRIVCDGGRACVPKVLSGAHPGFTWEQGETIEKALVRLMLTRGEGATDEQMIDAMGGTQLGFMVPFYALNEAYIERLKILAKTETPPVRTVACEILSDLKRPCGNAER